jgi:predicted phosphohydrolase
MIDGIAQWISLIHYRDVQALPWPDSWSINEEKCRLTLHCLDNFEARTKAAKKTLLNGYHATLLQVSVSRMISATRSILPTDSMSLMSTEAASMSLAQDLSQYISLAGQTHLKGAILSTEERLDQNVAPWNARSHRL